MNIVLIDGGLGNQLFQLAFAMFLSETSDESVAIDVKIDADRHRHGIEGLADIAGSLNIPLYSGPRPTARVHLALFRRSLGTQRTLKPLAGLKSRVGWKGIYVYSGYWQDYEHLYPYYVRVADACREVLNIQRGNENCLHIRFGDYRSKKNLRIYSHLGLSYYDKGIKYIIEQTKCNNICVLTNEYQSAIDFFSDPVFEGVNFYYKPGGVVSDFLALGQSAALVASNSTFCWWGALISARTKGLGYLVSPLEWFNSGYRHKQAPSYAALSKLGGHMFENLYL